MDLRKKKWSFSSVKLFEQCPYAFYQKYIQDQTEEENAFAQHGKFAHSILERCLKGELLAFELADVFESEYQTNVTKSFPYANIAKSFYDKTLLYFQEYDDFVGEIVGVEEKLETKFGDIEFIGYADLIMRDEKGIYVVDHKSHAAFKSKKEREEYFRQLYLYAECVKRKYGEYPYKLEFNMFRVPQIVEEFFSQPQCDFSVNWFCESVNKILRYYEQKKIDWDCKIDNWYCSNLCGLDCAFRG